MKDLQYAEGPGNLSSTDYFLLASDGDASVEFVCEGRRVTLFEFRGQRYQACVHSDEDEISYEVYPVAVDATGTSSRVLAQGPALPWLPFELDQVRIERHTDLEALVRRTLGGWTPPAAPKSENPAGWALKLWSSLAGTSLRDEVSRAAGACVRSTDALARTAALEFFSRAGYLVPGAEVIEEVAAGDDASLDLVPDPIKKIPLGAALRFALSGRLKASAKGGRVPAGTLELAKRLILQPGRALGLVGGVAESDFAWFEEHAEKIVEATPEACTEVLYRLPNPEGEDMQEQGMFAARLISIGLASVSATDAEELKLWANSSLPGEALAAVQAAFDARAYARPLQTPEADEPRLACADAVQQTDPDRAELIRVQVQLAHSRRKGLPPLDRAEGYTRESILLDKHKDRWSKPVSEVGGVLFLRFFRGFVEQVRMSARDFLRHGELLYARAPILHLDLVELKPHAREVFDSPLLDRIHSLKLTRNQLDDHEAKALAASAHLRRLRWLDLSHNQIGQTGLEAIAASTGLPSLRYLDFASNAAPDPTPKIGETDTYTGEVVSLEISRQAGALEARFGKKPWLSPELDGKAFPPERDLF